MAEQTATARQFLQISEFEGLLSGEIAPSPGFLRDGKNFFVDEAKRLNVSGTFVQKGDYFQVAEDSCSGDPTYDGENTTITCATGGYSTDEFAEHILVVTSGTAQGNSYTIVSNTANQIVVEGDAVSDGLADTDTFRIEPSSSFEVYKMGEYIPEGENSILVCYGSDDRLYEYDGAKWVKFGSLASAEGDVNFVNFKSKLFIINSSNFKVWDGNTLSDVSASPGSPDPPTGRFALVYQDRLYVLSLANEPRCLSWSSLRDETKWNTLSGSLNKIQFDYPITSAAVIHDKLVVITEGTVEILEGSTGLLSPYYYPSKSVLTTSRGSHLRNSIAVGLNDIVFANKEGVFSISAVEKYGDLEKANLSWFIRELLSSYIPDDRASLIYVESKDEFWFCPKHSLGVEDIGRILILKLLPKNLVWSVVEGYGNHLFISSEEEVLLARDKIYSYTETPGSSVETKLDFHYLFNSSIPLKVLHFYLDYSDNNSSWSLSGTLEIDGQNFNFNYSVPASESSAFWDEDFWDQGVWPVGERRVGRLSFFVGKLAHRVKPEIVINQTSGGVKIVSIGLEVVGGML